MEIERATTGLFGVQVHFPGLAQRVRLYEMAFVMHMEAVVHGMVLEVGDESGNIDGSHGPTDCHAPGNPYAKER